MADSSKKQPPYDWSKFQLRVNIDCTIKEAYLAWATRAGIESWFLRKALFTREGKELGPDEKIQKGDKYAWYWHGWDDNTVEKGSILEANGKDRLSFQFGHAGEVIIRIFKEGRILIMELEQRNIPTDLGGQINFHLGCTKGWTFYLANLKSIFEGGIDLRNRKVDLRNVITA